MMKSGLRNLLLILAIFLLLNNLLALPEIKFSELKHDFGVFKEEAGIVIHDFKFINSGDGPFHITKVRAS